jgi:hypothetical protein
MNETDLRLDGNALAGTLDELFAVEMTSALGCCDSCGQVAALGGQHLYRYPRAPGAVLRCQACEGVLMVLVEGPSGWRVTLRGLRWLEIRSSTPIEPPESERVT